MVDEPQVTDNTQASRLELVMDGHVAELAYRRRADRLVIVHTGVPDALGGHGIGGRLVRAAVGQAATQGLTLVPLCRFAASWLRSHPDVAASVSIDWGGEPAG